MCFAHSLAIKEKGKGVIGIYSFDNSVLSKRRKRGEMSKQLETIINAAKKVIQDISVIDYSKVA